MHVLNAMWFEERENRLGNWSLIPEGLNLNSRRWNLRKNEAHEANPGGVKKK